MPKAPSTSPIRYNNRTQTFNATGGFLMEKGMFGAGDGQFRQPRGIAVDTIGNVYVVDTDNSRIQKFSSEGDFLVAWGTNGT